MHFDQRSLSHFPPIWPWLDPECSKVRECVEQWLSDPFSEPAERHSLQLWILRRTFALAGYCFVRSTVPAAIREHQGMPEHSQHLGLALLQDFPEIASKCSLPSPRSFVPLFHRGGSGTPSPGPHSPPGARCFYSIRCCTSSGLDIRSLEELWGQEETIAARLMQFKNLHAILCPIYPEKKL
jgi:hypothetical protein